MRKLAKTPSAKWLYCISWQVIYNFSAFVSSYFRVSFSRERKTKRIERKFKTQNPNLGVFGEESPMSTAEDFMPLNPGES